MSVRDGQGHGHVKPRPDGAKARCLGPRGCKVCAAELEAAALEWTNAVAAAEAERGALYTERALLVAHLATVHPASIEYDPAAPEWPVCSISLPFGLAGWHIAAADLTYFDHVRRGGGPPYDGHTKREALERLELTTAARGAA